MLLRTNGPHDDLANNRLELSQHIAAKKKAAPEKRCLFVCAGPVTRGSPTPPRVTADLLFSTTLPVSAFASPWRSWRQFKPGVICTS